MPRSNEYDGATCSACDWPLDRDGCCKNETCGFSFCNQDDPSGWLYNQDQKRKPAPMGRFEIGCVIANARSKKYRLPGDKGCVQAKRARHVIFFRTEDHATANGYRRSMSHEHRE
jgi:hypothetical protein